ncbi:acetolactate synthase-1/2/3 large subunit [Fontibacillus phaseoli]|uniref:Acetolactate synthase-1/2/3 large subunit n=1 Tax=Fontibacillus phaseoli TaxID=1416533 RepID=A0A369BBU7_9BACL|nr:thiamine pyrophosphate-binding protein [Fontibacillus phaseoli]RCX19010.1 acetolactate synthase-1/2/3 large subunit [Fontibacillus phaseoli]
MKLSDYVIDCLKKEGISHVFEFIGGAIVHLLDSISLRNDIECISVRHEQAGAFAAEAYARMNGKLGVAMATSGPGALNLLTGIGSCYFDSVPCLFITGQVNTYEYKFDKPVRQIGFQETDIVSVAKPLTKYAELVTDPKNIRYELEKAVYLAQKGRPGPVLLDIPMNVQRADIDPDTLESFYESEEYYKLEGNKAVSIECLDHVVSLIKDAKRPLVLAGGGVRLSNACEELKLFLDLTGLPLVSSLMGLDVIPHSNPQFVGLIGSYGNRYSNLALANCDLLIILGSRLDSRQTGTRPDTFARGAKKIHVDIDSLELNNKVQVDISIKSDLRQFLSSLNSALVNFKRPNISEWQDMIKTLKEKYPTYSFKPSENEIEPNRFMELLSSKSGHFGAVCLDVGQHQMWASQSFEIQDGQRLINSGGMGAMGFALPAAIGAALASSKEVLVIAGDGGIQLNIQELDTITRLHLPIKIVVLNNNSLGMVRQFQDLYMDGRQQSTVNKNPSFNAVFKAYGIPSYQIDSSDNVAIVDEFLSVNGPSFLEVRLEKKTEVHPKLVVNRPIEDMFPYLDRKELKEIMLIDLVEEMDIPK